MKMAINLKKIGPGLLFAGAAIGVSHLVQSTRAGADFGWGLLWALFLSNIFKYPFFQFGSRFALATHKSLLDGYAELGKGYLWLYFLLSLGTMFTIQTAVTIVTASLASILFGIDASLVVWSIIITLFCLALLWKGSYVFLDKLIKGIILVLTVSTIVAVVFAGGQNTTSIPLTQILPSSASFLFLAAFMGWMPAPMDISVWQSLWMLEKNKAKNISLKEGLFDFNVGYFVTFFLGVCFMGLGTYVMFGTGTSFSNSGSIFAKQLIDLYTSSLGDAVYIFIVIAAFTTMFSTTLTTLDASPRAMEKASQLLLPKFTQLNFRFWIILLAAGTIGIFTFLRNEMGTLVQIATILSFLTAPFYAFLNYRLVTSKHMPMAFQPSKGLKALSIFGLIFLVLFAVSFVFMVI
ncbi:Nramp family divalent metal transporter [Flavobacteriaceae bacterium]|nr:Nramp family divalent metal transporter [Flavobacteriaceae bacterium]MDA9184225.1 Nramp family divalent metal transporter [Flavobacteriaceae bacterium]MDA9244995.1 Nramp family divalent metal transporter [Flavobacteriaceae bacterium]MDA9294703.1 Nramp family divalent metal transporter [Flavobacteriaceae bacterium]MDA9885901.1 Nramp family divalent metal transporter [Flavobacteriaceae bacterium]